MDAIRGRVLAFRQGSTDWSGGGGATNEGKREFSRITRIILQQSDSSYCHTALQRQLRLKEGRAFQLKLTQWLQVDGTIGLGF